MSPEAQNVLRLASLVATRRVRMFAVNQTNYRGGETEAGCARALAEAKAAFEAAVEELDKKRMA